MVSHTYKCIFVHIPKCAGTSIEKALGHLDGHIGREGQDHRTIEEMKQISLNVRSLTSKKNVKEYLRRIKFQYLTSIPNERNKITVSEKEFNEYFKFTVVRNPWSRVYSAYKNVMRDEMHKANYGISSDIPFSKFLEDNLGQRMLRPQTFWLKDTKGEIPMDFIGKFEEIENTFTEIRQQLDFPNLIFPHELHGKSTDYRLHYDQKSIDLVQSFYEEEIHLFNYSFE